MAVREILKLGHPLLWKKCAIVTEFSSQEVQKAITDLKDTLADFRAKNNFGRGIAAPQIGVPLRIIYIHMPDGSFDGPMINPVIVAESKDTFELWDDCFSFPDLLVRVSRAKTITVTYCDETGAIHRVEVQNAFSELLQHEIDHVNGILAVQRAVSPDAFALRKEWEKFYKNS
ncbi:peptide deformylase [bacterium]|nr:peptide deformylase [bacterium]